MVQHELQQSIHPSPLETDVPPQLPRRQALRILFTGAVVVGVSLAAPGLASAETDQPDEPDVPLSPEEQKKKHDLEMKLLESEVAKNETERKKNEAETELARVEREKTLKETNPSGGRLVERFLAASQNTIVTLAAVGGLFAYVRNTIQKRKADREEQQQEAAATKEAQRLEEAAQRIKVDGEYREVVDKIGTLMQLGERTIRDGKASSEKALASAYSQLRNFLTYPHLRPEIFKLCVGLLRGRASEVSKPLPETGETLMNKTQIEARLNTDRELIELFAALAPLVTRDQSSECRPQALGISFDHIRFMRFPAEGLDMTGAYANNLLVTGSLRNSNLTHARLRETTFGEFDGVGPLDDGLCDLRDTNFKGAALEGARFERVLVNANTVIDPSEQIGFGTVFSDTLTEDQLREKFPTAERVQSNWKDHHEDALAKAA